MNKQTLHFQSFFQARISNHMPSNTWKEITYTFSNLNGDLGFHIAYTMAADDLATQTAKASAIIVFF